MARLRNPRRELFAIEIASGTPPDRAYVAAGFRGGKWARPNASKLAHDPRVAARIAELQKQYAIDGGLQASYVQAKLLPLIEADIRDLFEKDADGKPRLRKLTELPDGIAAALSSVKIDAAGHIHEFKLASKTDAARTLLQSIGAIIEQHAHTCPVPANVQNFNLFQNLSIDDQRIIAEALEADAAREIAPAAINEAVATGPKR